MSIKPQSFRYDTSGQWHKGNTHVHSTASDGGKNHRELAELYAAAGYDFLFATDHRVPSDLAGRGSSPLLWLDGVELDGYDDEGENLHVVCLGRTQGITPRMGFMHAVESAREQHALVILAHPQWCGNTTSNALRWHFDGVEIYNHVCRWLNGKDDGRVYWNAMLERNPNTLAFSVDDAHLTPEHPGWNGGWIVVNTHEWSAASVLGAIRRGNYYSSCGPEFRTIESDGHTVQITTSPVQFIRLVGPGPLGARLGSFDGAELTAASFVIPAEWAYVYLEIEDSHGRRAWTNTLFVNERPT